MELLTNADRALTVHRIAQPTITIEVSATEGEAKIAVRDNGPGVTDKIRDRLWEPFVSGYESTGLGLAVVWDSVEKHGGSIEYRFEDPGACFTVSLPCRSQFSDQRRAAS
jgi:nitrogen-specific signal transduction histidine kinase